MKRTPIKQVEASKLIVDRNVNYRQDYDIPSMIEEIRSIGRVLEPVWVRQEDHVVLKGNRRVTAVHELLKDPALPSDLKEAITKLDVIFVSDLSEKELTEMVLDHGSQKPLSRVETVLAVWRLQKQMYTEREIITVLYNQLARFTGQTRKAYEAQSLPQGQGREAFLTKWLHGTVGNYLLSAGKMGEYIRRQLILTETAVDRDLSPEEKEEHAPPKGFEVTRDRVNKLASAIKTDRETPNGWHHDRGGDEFNKVVAKFKEEDSGNGKEKAPARASSKVLDDTAATMKSRLRNAYKHCAGTLPEGERVTIEELDTDIYRMDKLREVARANLDRIKANETFSGEEVKELLRFFVTGTEAEFEKYLARFIKS